MTQVRDRPGTGIQEKRDGGAALVFARAAARKGIRPIVAWRVAQALGRLAVAGSLAFLAGSVIGSGVLSLYALAIFFVGLAIVAATGLVADTRTASEEARLAGAIRGIAERSLCALPLHRLQQRPVGALVAGLQRHPGALAGLVVGHATARVMLAVGPLLSAAAVASVSWQAAVVLLLSVPVMIVFFVLAGSLVRAKAEAQEKAFGRLAAQFSDRIRTLPTILANQALERERLKLDRGMSIHADSTMGLLRVAFLNAGIIDFFSALSIAVLAVLLGLGHLGLIQIAGFSGLKLWQSLTVLVIAADFFAPFRRYAEQYHAKAEGEAAAGELDWYFDPGEDVAGGEAEPGCFVLAYTGKRLAIALPPTGLVAVTGASGSGKSTLLRTLAGIERAAKGTAPSLPRCDWISTDIRVPAGSLAEAVAWGRGPVPRSTLLMAASRVGLLDDRLLPGGLDARIAEGGANLSGGQRLRIGIARGLCSDRPILADEPTAKLDGATAALVRKVIVETARDRLVIVATHDPSLIELAVEVVDVTLDIPAAEAIAA